MASVTCLPVQVPVIQGGMSVNDMSMALGFFVGVALGGLVAFLCAKLCARDMDRSSKQQVLLSTPFPMLCLEINEIALYCVRCVRLHFIVFFITKSFKKGLGLGPRL